MSETQQSINNDLALSPFSGPNPKSYLFNKKLQKLHSVDRQIRKKWAIINAQNRTKQYQRFRQIHQKQKNLQQAQQLIKQSGVSINNPLNQVIIGHRFNKIQRQKQERRQLAVMLRNKYYQEKMYGKSNSKNNIYKDQNKDNIKKKRTAVSYKIKSYQRSQRKSDVLQPLARKCSHISNEANLINQQYQSLKNQINKHDYGNSSNGKKHIKTESLLVQSQRNQQQFLKNHRQNYNQQQLQNQGFTFNINMNTDIDDNDNTDFDADIQYSKKRKSKIMKTEGNIQFESPNEKSSVQIQNQFILSNKKNGIDKFFSVKSQILDQENKGTFINTLQRFNSKSKSKSNQKSPLKKDIIHQVPIWIQKRSPKQKKLYQIISFQYNDQLRKMYRQSHAQSSKYTDIKMSFLKKIKNNNSKVYYHLVAPWQPKDGLQYTQIH